VRRALAAADRGPDAVLAAALAVLAEDVAACRALGERGADLLAELCGDRPLNLHTHCNAGALACVEWGTALGIVRSLHARGRVAHVVVDETRPLLQGARITATELVAEGIDHHVVVDGAAPSIIARGLVDAVVVGADRVAANGDVANKIGTYPLALAAARAGIPFVVAIPESTFDPGTPDGAAIEIEERAGDEVLVVNVAGRRHRAAPRGTRRSTSRRPTWSPPSSRRSAYGDRPRPPHRPRRGAVRLTSAPPSSASAATRCCSGGAAVGGPRRRGRRARRRRHHRRAHVRHGRHPARRAMADEPDRAPLGARDRPGPARRPSPAVRDVGRGRPADRGLRAARRRFRPAHRGRRRQVAELVPAAQHGRALGWYGIAVGAPQLVLLAAGVRRWTGGGSCRCSWPAASPPAGGVLVPSSDERPPAPRRPGPSRRADRARCGRVPRRCWRWSRARWPRAAW
jgi:hypothetical protein